MKMDAFYNIIVNVSPILILMFFLLSYFILDLFDKEFFETKIPYLYLFFHGLISIKITQGYGNIIIGMIILGITVLIFCGNLVFWIFNLFDTPLFGEFIIIFVNLIYIAIFVLMICYRLKLENIIDINFVDIIMSYVEKVDLSEQLFMWLINNEWTKEILIGIISSIIGGLFLEKMKKKKRDF